jgi:WD40 repeat protein
MSTIRTLAMYSVLFAIGACKDREPLAPVQLRPGSAQPEIVDAVHNAGNAHFFFLPPMVPAPAFTGIADGLLAPTVTICQWDGGCIAEFNVTADGDHQYHVNWQTDQCYWGPCTLNSGDIYRLTVSVGSKELGHADLIVVTSQGKAKNLQTNEYIALVDGRTLPVKFRIETGVVAGLSILPNPASVPVGANLQLNATATDLHGNVIANPTLTWSTTATALATATPAGVLTGVKSGCLRVIATSEDLTTSAEVKVTPLKPDLLFQDDQRVLNDGAYYIYAGRVDACIVPYRVSSTHAARDGLLSVSPDGTRVAFVGDRDEDLTIRIASIDGSGETSLNTPSIRASWPSWSPDGRRIAFAGSIVTQSGNNVSFGATEGFMIDADGSNVRRLTYPNLVGSPLRWSPTGDRLAFFHEVSSRNLITIINQDGTNPVDLTSAPTYASYPEWFSDGNRIAYVDLGDASIGIVQIATAESHRLTPPQNQLISGLALSPDGAQIAYTAYTCGGTSLDVLTVDAGAVGMLACLLNPKLLLTYGPTTPAWSADGTELLFSSLIPGMDPPRLFAITRDGLATRALGTGYGPVVIRH